MNFPPELEKTLNHIEFHHILLLCIAEKLGVTIEDITAEARYYLLERANQRRTPSCHDPNQQS